ncbi:MAG: tRNA glutamyl-Q(34) synthetase GluQRS, partial [Gammaproteobacteria bacterium]|nr:tRNA glutamyl-Q(34) synthetase GluQRS [Gammaproteobacteria bacterium]
MTLTTPQYTGRFAPSPTGPLHLGSLIAAVGSYLEARSHHGRWLLRMEDVDLHRNIEGASDDILRTLELFGFEWDEHVLYQSTRYPDYEQVVAELRDNHLAYPCGCTRKLIDEQIAQHGLTPGIYPGTCRNGLAKGMHERAIRVQIDDRVVSFEDALQGVYQQHLPTEVGDFVIHRADGVYAYQLAVTVDDAAQGITHVVRGSDLLDSTPRQIYLQQVLGYTTPKYVHLPVIVNHSGQKLSKQTYASPLDTNKVAPLLVQALSYLGHSPAQGLDCLL